MSELMNLSQIAVSLSLHGSDMRRLIANKKKDFPNCKFPDPVSRYRAELYSYDQVMNWLFLVGYQVVVFNRLATLFIQGKASQINSSRE
jgi:hypothetical protein